MRRLSLLAVPSIALMLGGGACAGSDDPSAKEFKDDLSAELVDTLDLDQDTADCYANVIVDELGVERLNKIDVATDAPADDEQADYIEAVQKAASECD